MSRIAYVNGRFLPHQSASIHVEDRAMQFSDGVYEVFAVVGGELIDLKLHCERLLRSLNELKMRMPLRPVVLQLILQEVIHRNRIREGICYLQITRGSSPRNHVFPTNLSHSIVITARRSNPASGIESTQGVRIITTPDLRWHRRDIKSVSLLPNVLAKQSAAEANAFEAWLINKNGLVTEGSHSNAWIIVEDGTIITHPESVDILSGVTRNRILQTARDNNIPVKERKFSVGEAKRAREAFLTSTSSFVVPVIQIDDAIVGNGEPGLVTQKLRRLYLEEIHYPFSETP